MELREEFCEEFQLKNERFLPVFQQMKRTREKWRIFFKSFFKNPQKIEKR